MEHKLYGIQTAIQPHRQVESQYKEIYGKGDVVLRIGRLCWSLGATGLLKILATDYLSQLPSDGSIAWVFNHSRNTQLALNYGFIDIALTYEREHEAQAAAEGWSLTAGCVFHDHFCLAGPTSDPAGLMLATDLSEALQRIATYRALFHSRADGSATMWKERSLWSSCGLSPWEVQSDENWYKMTSLSPSDAVIQAGRDGAYLLIDRSTILRQAALQTITSTTVFFEPLNTEDLLMNSCYALHSPMATPQKLEEVRRFMQLFFQRDHLHSTRPLLSLIGPPNNTPSKIQTSQLSLIDRSDLSP